MDNKKSLHKILELLDKWEMELNNYTIEELQKNPSENDWSLGQVYMHLVNSTLGYHLKQMNVCIQSNNNRTKRKNMKGFVSYNILGDVPNIKIKVPSSQEYTPKQPNNKEEIVSGLQKVRKQMKLSFDLIENTSNKGKALHPGFSYLNGEEWYRLVPMHFKHHLRQKERIDTFLEK